MLSISKPFKGTGRANYYLNLAQEDYYLGGTEPPGFWLGEAADPFGLSGTVKGDAFRNLLAGFNADGSSALVHNAGSTLRRSGWDLTWSVPKSVSAVWSQAPKNIRAVIENDVREAVLAARGEEKMKGREMAIATFWNSLSEPERIRLEAEALAQANGMEKDILER